MRLFKRRRSAGQDKIDIVLVGGVINHVGPSLRIPEFLGAGRAGMKNDELFSNVVCFQKFVGFFAGAFRKVRALCPPLKSPARYSRLEISCAPRRSLAWSESDRRCV